MLNSKGESTLTESHMLTQHTEEDSTNMHNSQYSPDFKTESASDFELKDSDKDQDDTTE
jgi:hypothetical protein